MRILLIEDPPVANLFASYCPDIEVYDLQFVQSLGVKIENVAMDIKEHYAHQVDIYMINVNLQDESGVLTQNNGIKLLKMLRLHHINKHVVLYSFLDREMLMSDTRNAIVFSKGVSFYRLPEILNRISTLDWAQLSKEEADARELRLLFMADYDPDDRHFNANVFGVWKLKKAYESYLEIIKGEELSDSERVQIKELKYMNSYYGLLYQYISEVSSRSVIDTDSETECSVCDKICSKIDKLRARKDYVLYVDDMGTVGWSELLGEILFGDDRERYFRTIFFDKKASIENIANLIIKFGLERANLLILDLRLRNEYGYVKPSELSGIKVLRELERKIHLHCPVLIFTASNKIGALKETFEGDVMAYYIKEETAYSDNHTSLMNFLNLIEQICFLTSHSWFFEILSRLKKLSETIHDEENKFWWETMDATYLEFDHRTYKEIKYDRIHTDKSDIVNILDKVVESVQNEMRHICFFKNSLSVSDVLSSFLLRLSLVFNEIHKSKQSGYDKECVPSSLSELMKAHLPKLNTKEYLRLRNQAAHQRTVSYKLPEVVKTVDLIVQYLILKPTKYYEDDSLETNITPINDRCEKLKQKEPIFVELEGVSLNGRQAGKKSHGYFYKFILGGQDEHFVLSDSLLENVGKGDIVQIRNIGESNVPIDDMELQIVI